MKVIVSVCFCGVAILALATDQPVDRSPQAGRLMSVQIIIQDGGPDESVFHQRIRQDHALIDCKNLIR